MGTLNALVKRNIKLFFKDKGMFFTSLVTPAILLVLYVTFLGNVYRDSFLSAFPAGLEISEELIEMNFSASSLLPSHFFHFGGLVCDGGVLLQSAYGTGQGKRHC